MARTTAPQETSKKVPNINLAPPEKKLVSKEVASPTTPEQPVSPKSNVPTTTPPLLEKPKAPWPKYLLFGVLGLIVGAALGALALQIL